MQRRIFSRLALHMQPAVRGGPAALGGSPPYPSRRGERPRSLTYGRVVGESALVLVDPVPGPGHADLGHVGHQQLADVSCSHLPGPAAARQAEQGAPALHGRGASGAGPSRASERAGARGAAGCCTGDRSREREQAGGRAARGTGRERAPGAWGGQAGVDGGAGGRCYFYSNGESPAQLQRQAGRRGAPAAARSGGEGRGGGPGWRGTWRPPRRGAATAAGDPAAPRRSLGTGWRRGHPKAFDAHKEPGRLSSACFFFFLNNSR